MFSYYLFLAAIYSILVVFSFLILIIFWGIFTKDKEDDFVFQFAKTRDKQFIIDRVAFLEKKNQRSYSKMYLFIEKYFEDNNLNEAEKGKLEEFLIHIYYKGFAKKWMVFRMSNWLYKSYFILCIISTFLQFNVIFFGSTLEINSEPINWFLFALTNVFGIVVLYLFSAIYLTGSSMLLMIIASLFGSKKGKLVKSYVILDEFIKCYKPAGRDTKFHLSNYDSSGFTRI